MVDLFIIFWGTSVLFSRHCCSNVILYPVSWLDSWCQIVCFLLKAISLFCKEAFTIFFLFLMFCNFYVLSMGLFLSVWWFCFYLPSIWWCVLLQLWEILFYYYFDIQPSSLSCCLLPEFFLAGCTFNFSSPLSYFLTLYAFGLYILGDILNLIS